MRRVSIVALLTMGLLVATIAPAGAKGQGKPEFQEKWSFFEEAHVDPFLTDVCGTDIYHEIKGKGHVKFYEDGSVIDHFNVTTTNWNPATGDTVIRQEAGNFRGSFEEVFDPASETVTITWDDTFVGLPSKWYKRGEGVLLRDAGLANFQGTVVLDVSGPPEEIFFEETLTIRGPHPELMGEFDEFVAIVCGALGA